MKNVLITGGSRGIGAEAARKFAKEGYRVWITYQRNKDAATHTLNTLVGGGHRMFSLDLNVPSTLKTKVSELLEEMGKVAVLVNNAGVFIENKIEELSYNKWMETWNTTMQVNMNGLAGISFLVSKMMIKQNYGHIVNVSSRGAFRGEPEHLAYGASKGALNAFSQSLAKALGKYNISVTAIAPGFVETDMAKSTLESDKGQEIKSESPLNRVSSPKEVADLIYFLSQKESIFLTGGIVDINGASFLRM